MTDSSLPGLVDLTPETAERIVHWIRMILQDKRFQVQVGNYAKRMTTFPPKHKGIPDAEVTYPNDREVVVEITVNTDRDKYYIYCPQLVLSGPRCEARPRLLHTRKLE